MHNLFQSIRKRPFLIGFTLFSLFILAGLITIKDYGITWDEPENFYIGRVYLNTFLFRDLSFLDKDRSLVIDTPIPFRIERHFERYPPFANTVASFFSLVLAEKLQLLHAVEAHHLAVLVCGALAVLTTFLLAFEITQALFPSIFSALMLFLLPQFMGNAHNNIKDIPVAALMILSVYFFIKLIKHFSYRQVFVLAIVSGLSIAAKFNGLFLFPILSISSILIFQEKLLVNKNFGKILSRGGVYLFLTLLTVFIFWPWLREEPLEKLSLVYDYITHVGRGLPVLFLGKSYRTGINLPFYYSIYWIAITTPFLILIMMLTGFFLSFKALFASSMHKRYILVLPIFVMVTLSRYFLPTTPVYNGMRHFLEVLPPLSILAGIGIQYLSNKIKNKFLIGSFASLVIFQLLIINWKMHPYQTLYFNFLSGGVKQASDNFEFDYWGTSVKEMVDYLNKYEEDKTKKININWINYQREYFPGNKFNFVESSDRADYIIIPHSISYFEGALYYWQKNGRLIYSVKRERATLGYLFATN